MGIAVNFWIVDCSLLWIFGYHIIHLWSGIDFWIVDCGLLIAVDIILLIIKKKTKQHINTHLFSCLFIRYLA